MRSAAHNAPFDLRDAERVEPIAERLPRLLGQMDELYRATVEMLDNVHRDGFAESHPELVGQLLLANALHSLSEGLDERLLWLRDQVAGLVDTLDNLKGAVRQVGKDLSPDGR